jgi:Ca2+-binding EF-hand superfamily protein
MAYTLIILTIVMYIFGILGVELITRNELNVGSHPDRDFQEHVELYFPDLPNTMMTLLNFACLDNMSDVWLDLIAKDGWLAIYFVAIVLVMGIVIMNIVAAVIHISITEHDSAEIEESKRDQEGKLASVIQELKRLFCRIDTDGSGYLTREEVMNISEADQKFLAGVLGTESCKEVFESLDVDRSGRVTINDFFDGLWDATAFQKDLKLQRMEKQVEIMHWRIKETFDSHVQLQHTVASMAVDMKHLMRSLDVSTRDSQPQTPTSETSMRQAAARRSSLESVSETGGKKVSLGEEGPDRVAEEWNSGCSAKSASSRRAGSAPPKVSKAKAKPKAGTPKASASRNAADGSPKVAPGGGSRAAQSSTAGQRAEEDSARMANM